MTTLASLLWLNLAMLPCTMAASGEEHAGQDPCPPSAAVSHHGHMAEHGSSDGHHDAGAVHAEQHHDAKDHPCMAGDDCCEVDDVLFSDGAKKLERDAGALPPVSYASAQAEYISKTSRNLHATGPPPAYAGAIRRHALHCVYRD